LSFASSFIYVDIIYAKLIILFSLNLSVKTTTSYSSITGSPDEDSPAWVGDECINVGELEGEFGLLVISGRGYFSSF
jgi:hypothetical protein